MSEERSAQGATIRRAFGRYVVEIESPDRVLFPECGTTTGHVAEYYEWVADVLLPHVEGRAVAMERYPEGIAGKAVFDRLAPGHFPDWIERLRVPARGGGRAEHVVVRRAADLVYLAGQACVTPYVWASRAADPERPDRMVFDLDPPGDDFTEVKAAARALRGVLEDLDLVPFVMTTGSRGLHVVVPIQPEAGFDEVRRFARGVARTVAAREPGRFTTGRRQAARGGRAYVGALRNGFGQTTVAPYAVRARPGTPVATPLAWEELRSPRVGPTRYTIETIFRRLGHRDDPWAGMARRARALAERWRRLTEVLAEAGAARAPARG